VNSIAAKPLDSSSDPVHNGEAGVTAQAILVSCVYIALHCPACGALRQALHELPSSEAVSCPRCGTSSVFVLLGAGLTTRALPFYEVLSRERLALNVPAKVAEIALRFRYRPEG